MSFLMSGCAIGMRPKTALIPVSHPSVTAVQLHRQSLELYLTAPVDPVNPGVLVLYASGDGGWFGAAVDMFRQIGAAGYYAVGFSSRSFLKIDRRKGKPITVGQVAEDYGQIIDRARAALGLIGPTRVLLTGWSRGAAVAVLVGSEPSALNHDVAGVIAIGLSEGEDLAINGAEDETDDGQTTDAHRPWPFEPYARIAQLTPARCAVIQATRDQYLPAARARALFGNETALKRFYSIDAKNHRFSGGKDAFDSALRDALAWITTASSVPRGFSCASS